MQIIVLGLESAFVFETADVLKRLGLSSIAYVMSRWDSCIVSGLAPILALEDAAIKTDNSRFIIPLLTPGRRKRAASEAFDASLSAAAPIVDPSAVVSPRAALSDGSFVGALSTVGANCILEPFVTINRSASIGHDVVMKEYSTLGPGATVCGACIIQEGAFIGGGATIAPKVTIGRNSVVSAGAVVFNDVSPNTTVLGNPARVVRTAIAGYRDIGV
jgi:sugar O-acyltransferase (sialic acid O-acetyltransferase NeuD family)